jgi:hypothetical protein
MTRRLLLVAALTLLAPSFAAAAGRKGGRAAKGAKVTKGMEWMKGTTWHWNGWKDVTFNADGSFDAPTPDCEVVGKCKWSAKKKDAVEIKWGKSGLHRVRVSPDGTKMQGKRVKDGQPCEAVYVSGKGFSIWKLLPKMPKAPKWLANLPEASLGMVGAAAARIGEPWVPGFFSNLGVGFAVLAVSSFVILFMSAPAGGAPAKAATK